MTATAYLQAAIDHAAAKGGGVIDLGDEVFSLTASEKVETYKVYGGTIFSENVCLIVPANVSLIGRGAWLNPAEPNLTAILMLDPNRNRFEGFGIDGGWSGIGAGHGIFDARTGASNHATQMQFLDLEFANLGSYAIGLQNNLYSDTEIVGFDSVNTGADAIDVKGRTATGHLGDGIRIERASADKFGQRLPGCAAFDLRGDCMASKLRVRIEARANTPMFGIRARHLDSNVSPDYSGEECLVTEFDVTADIPDLCTGVMIGASDVSVAHGRVKGCADGVRAAGNSHGDADRANMTDITVRGADRAFSCSASCNDLIHTACGAYDSDIGFRNEGADSRYIGCTADCNTNVSKSTAASATHVEVGCNF